MTTTVSVFMPIFEISHLVHLNPMKILGYVRAKDLSESFVIARSKYQLDSKQGVYSAEVKEDLILAEIKELQGKKQEIESGILDLQMLIQIDNLQHE